MPDPQPRPAERSATSLRVATWNAYLGADLEPVAKAADADTLARATQMAMRQAERTRFPERAKVIADVIGRGRPEVIGLQEIGRWQIEKSSGREVLWDHRELVIDALESRGEPYVMLSCNDTFTGQLPLDEDRTITFTNCDAMLLRATPERPITVLDADSGHFDARLDLPIAGTDEMLEVKRGWVQADLEIGDRRVRVITTHLDSMDAGVRAKQAHELVSVASPSPYPVVLLGDFNTGDGDGVRGVIRRAGYEDAWAKSGHGEGLTWGRSADLDIDKELVSRVDYVFYDPHQLSVRNVELIGADAAARTPGDDWRWASDHAGVLAELEIS